MSSIKIRIRSQNSSVWLCLLICMLWWGCANIVPPDGGEKDNTAPVLRKISPGDSLTNVRPKKIELSFDEFVKVEDAVSQVQISPLLPSLPTLTVKARKVIINLPDTALQNNTTYTITLGSAIKDIHEGNAFNGAPILFSTGAYFDSLTLSGQLINARTGMPDSGKILLYPAEKDMDAVLKEKPLYVASTQANGSFTIAGLPERSFRVFALRENDKNYNYDKDEEWFAFNDKIYNSGQTSIIDTLRLFQEIPDTAMATTTSKKSNMEGSSNLNNQSKKDFSYKVAIDTNDINKRTQDIMTPLSIEFTQPIAALDTEKISLTYVLNNVTETATFQVKPDSVSKLIYHVETKWAEAAVYTLRLFKGFAADTSKEETMPSKYIFKTKSEEDYAKLTVNVPANKTGKGFYLELMDKSKLFRKVPITDTTISMSYLPSVTMSLKIFFDSNGNGEWDTGHFKERKQPEPVYPFPNEEKLRAGWSNIVDYNSKKSGKR